jgi:hypothetical protein
MCALTHTGSAAEWWLPRLLSVLSLATYGIAAAMAGAARASGRRLQRVCILSVVTFFLSKSLLYVMETPHSLQYRALGEPFCNVPSIQHR